MGSRMKRWAKWVAKRESMPPFMSFCFTSASTIRLGSKYSFRNRGSSEM